VQAAGRIGPHQRAAARADLHDLDRRRLNRVAGAAGRPADVVQRVHPDGAVPDGRRLGRGPADIQGEDVPRAQPPAQLGGGDHACHRPGLQQRDRRGSGTIE
jgi:hypothetical protein